MLKDVCAPVFPLHPMSILLHPTMQLFCVVPSCTLTAPCRNGVPVAVCGRRGWATSGLWGPTCCFCGDCILTSCTVEHFSRQLRSASSRTTDLWAPLSWALYLVGAAVFAFSKLAPGGPAAAIKPSRPCLCFLAHDSPASLLEVRTKRLSSPLKEVVLEFPDRWAPSWSVMGLDCGSILVSKACGLYTSQLVHWQVLWGFLRGLSRLGFQGRSWVELWRGAFEGEGCWSLTFLLSSMFRDVIAMLGRVWLRREARCQAQLKGH